MPTTEAPTTTEVTTTSEPTTEAPTTAEVTTTSEPTTEAPTTAEVTTTLKPTTEVTTTLEPTTEKQTETTVTVEPTTEILTTENTTSETTVENQTTNGKTTTRVDGVNKKSLKQTKILKVKKLKNRKVRVTFKKVSKAKIYRIQYSTDRKFKKNVRTKRTGKNTYLLRKLRVRKRYYVRVRAIVGKDKGKWSSVKSFKVSKRFYK